MSHVFACQLKLAYIHGVVFCYCYARGRYYARCRCYIRYLFRILRDFQSLFFCLLNVIHVHVHKYTRTFFIFDRRGMLSSVSPVRGTNGSCVIRRVIVPVSLDTVRNEVTDYFHTIIASSLIERWDRAKYCSQWHFGRNLSISREPALFAIINTSPLIDSVDLQYQINTKRFRYCPTCYPTMGSLQKEKALVAPAKSDTGLLARFSDSSD